MHAHAYTHAHGSVRVLPARCSAWKAQPAVRVAFAIERTLLMPGTLAPIARNVDYLRQLHTQGHQIVLTASRGTPAAERAAIERRLRELAIPHDALDFSRVDADLYVDALAIDAMQGDR